MKVNHILSHNNINLEVFSSLKSGPSSAELRTWSDRFCHALSIYLKSALLFNKVFGKSWVNSKLKFTIVLCADGKMKKLNQLYRGKKSTTDVLSFPLHQDLYLGTKKKFGPVDHLGDIFISYPKVKIQAQRFNISNEDEFYHLAAHGTLHLLGFDHERSFAEEKLMKKEENKILKNITRIKKRKIWKTL